MKVNSFAVFGDHTKWSTGIGVNLRIHHTLYSGWDFVVHSEQDLHDAGSGYCKVVDKLQKEGLLRLVAVGEGDGSETHRKRWLCMMMLWRMLPLWQEGAEYVFCRDMDSILTPRQLQCVRTFIASGKAAHGVNDNDAHSIPLMGGMCGFKVSDFHVATNHQSLETLVRDKYPEERWRRHGTDQDFIMDFLWPNLRVSFLHHDLRGPNERFALKRVTDADIGDIPQGVRERGDDFTNYIGAQGDRVSRKEIVEFYNCNGNVPKCAEITKIEKDCGWNW